MTTADYHASAYAGYKRTVHHLTRRSRPIPDALHSMAAQSLERCLLAAVATALI